MLSIQSLMNEEPYYNEPGYEHWRKNGQSSYASITYNRNIEYQTVRVAVIGMLENSPDARNMPKELKDVMVGFFKANYKFYEDLIRQKMNEKPPDPPLRRRLPRIAGTAPLIAGLNGGQVGIGGTTDGQVANAAQTVNGGQTGPQSASGGLNSSPTVGQMLDPIVTLPFSPTVGQTNGPIGGQTNSATVGQFIGPTGVLTPSTLHTLMPHEMWSGLNPMDGSVLPSYYFHGLPPKSNASTVPPPFPHPTLSLPASPKGVATAAAQKDTSQDRRLKTRMLMQNMKARRSLYSNAGLSLSAGLASGLKPPAGSTLQSANTSTALTSSTVGHTKIGLGASGQSPAHVWQPLSGIAPNASLASAGGVIPLVGDEPKTATASNTALTSDSGLNALSQMHAKFAKMKEAMDDFDDELDYMGYGYRSSTASSTQDYGSLLFRLQKLRDSHGIAPAVPDEAIVPEASNGETETSVESYEEVAKRMMTKIPESRPKPVEECDSWEDLIYEMNEELEDDDLEEYEEADDDDDDHVDDDDQDITEK